MALTKVDKTLLEATGTADATTYLRGDGSWAAIASAGFNSVQTPSTGTYTKTAGTNKIIVEVQAGGGGGSSGNGTQWGGNGGGGSYVKQYIDVSAISTATVAVGVGGTGGTSPTEGGTSSFVCTGVSISCLGGDHGEYHTSGHNDGGLGGVATATGATVLMNGQNGSSCYSYGQQGGDSGLGLGGNHFSYNGGTGQTPSGYGAGGGGGAGTSAGGVNGGVGIIIVWEYK